MKNYNPLLLIDFYKSTHHEQYPKGLTKMVSYYTPRMSRLKDVDTITFFGLQAFIKEYLIDGFDTMFFNRPEDEVVAEYERILDYTLGKGAYESQKIRDLHKLGYLPLEISAVPEGVATTVGVPQIEITNTHPDFVWLVNTIETMLSCTMWHTQVSAEVGKRYRKIVDEYVEKTCDPDIRAARMLGDFSMRGQHCHESAMKASAAWLCSFLNTATVPAILWLEDNYNCDIEKEEVGYGALSFEHSTVTSNYALDGNEETLLKRALTEIYPNDNFSFLTDSYDHDNFLKNVIPACKEEILAHNGTILFRGDSGDPVEVITDMVFALWDIFGGTINEKGYKVLDKHVKAIYGDSITPQRCEAVYKILEEAGFSIQNVSLGVGSFSFMCLEEFVKTDIWDANGDPSTETYIHYNPYTRDTFGVAVKATYMEDKDHNPIPIFKNPKEASFKKSQKGCCSVFLDTKGNFIYEDGMTYAERTADMRNLLEPIFANGKMIKEYTLAEVRDRLHKGEF